MHVYKIKCQSIRKHLITIKTDFQQTSNKVFDVSNAIEFERRKNNSVYS